MASCTEKTVEIFRSIGLCRPRFPADLFSFNSSITSSIFFGNQITGTSSAWFLRLMVRASIMTKLGVREMPPLYKMETEE